MGISTFHLRKSVPESSLLATASATLSLSWYVNGIYESSSSLAFSPEMHTESTSPSWTPTPEKRHVAQDRVFPAWKPDAGDRHEDIRFEIGYESSWFTGF